MSETGEGTAGREANTPVTRTRSLGDATVDLPEAWTVASIITAPAERGQYAANLVVSRDRPRHSESFATYATRQLIELGKHLRQFKLHGRRDLELGGRPAHEIACAWTGERGPIEQRITMVDGEGSILTFTATMPKAKVKELEPIFARVVASATLT